MIPFKPSNLTNSGSTDSVEQYYKLVQSLVDERKAIVEECQHRIREAQFQRDKELERNLEYLRKIGVKDSDIPHLQLGTGRKFRKLEPTLIREILLENMEVDQWYPSTPLLQLLQISYPDFKKFVASNPDFIAKEGVNKGTRYRLNRDI